MTQTKTYQGGCHCKKVRYEVELDLGKPVMACNCSMCSKVGSLLSFVPVDRFTLLSGGDALSDYQFGSHNIHHRFCSNCGIRSFGGGTGPDGSEMRAINVRCLDDVDLEALNVTHFDGKSL
jgi:hypothetical protein